MKIMVCGAGIMGSGIAQVFAEAGHFVYLRDIEERFVAQGIDNINKSLIRNVEKGKITVQDKAKIMLRIDTTVDLGLAKDVDLVLEAIIEKIDLKKTLFQQLEEICSPETIFATNTSALSISEIASSIKKPGRVIGIHFFNPAPVMKLVEVIKGVCTTEETYDFTLEFVKTLGKSPVTVEEAPGFVVNRILIPMVNEAAFILMEGIASAEDIDSAMKMGSNHPIGPLALGDLIGLDVCLFIMDTLYAETSDSKYRACPLLRKMVRAGYLGRKTVRGFFTY